MDDKPTCWTAKDLSSCLKENQILNPYCNKHLGLFSEQVHQQISLEVLRLVLNDHVPARVSDIIKAETFQRYSFPHKPHIKMISSTLRSRVLMGLRVPSSFYKHRPSVIATTLSDQAAVCLSPQVSTYSCVNIGTVRWIWFAIVSIKIIARCKNCHKPGITCVCVETVRFDDHVVRKTGMRVDVYWKETKWY